MTFNSAAHLDALLASLREVADQGHVAVVVVDNGSTDGTCEGLRGVPGIDLIEQGNVGYAGGVNRGIEAADDADDILVLNPDVVLGPGCLERLRAVLEERPDAGIVVPMLQDDRGVALPSLRRDPTVLRTLVETVVGGRRAGRFGEAYAADPGGGRREVDWATGAVMLLRRDVVTRIGPLDERFFLYSEETEYCMRARDAGFRVICEPRAVARHVGGEMGRNPRLWALRALNRVRLHRSRHGRTASALFRLASLLFELRRVLTGDLVSRSALRALASRDVEAHADERIRSLLAGGRTVP